jgi:hypothetical protein
MSLLAVHNVFSAFCAELCNYWSWLLPLGFGAGKVSEALGTSTMDSVQVDLCV